MKNLALVLTICLSLTVQGFAQLYIQSNSKGLYLEHTVVAKEGFFSVGRHYNVNPKFLAAYNNLDISKGLNIGQVIHIPLTDTNFSQQSSKGTPVYYRVGDREGLMKVSNANNKVKLASLREWNKLTSDNIKSGSRLIVGFLKPAENVAVTAAVIPKEEPRPQEIKKEEPKKAIEEKPVTSVEPAAEKPVVTTTVTPAQENAVETGKQDAVVAKPAVKEEPGTERPESSGTAGQGFFKPYFEQQVRQNPASRNETVTSGIFRTSYGLQEAKYYLLIDRIQPGTIVRIINPDNNRAVFAKVLGEMSGIRQNKGLDIRISDAAAATLGIVDTEKFIVRINY